jgi:hypothetical protein
MRKVDGLCLIFIDFYITERILHFILWRLEPLLCNDREMGGYIRAVSGPRLDKHVPAKQTTGRPFLGSRFLIMQQLDYINGRIVFFYVVRAERLYAGQG